MSRCRQKPSDKFVGASYGGTPLLNLTENYDVLAPENTKSLGSPLYLKEAKLVWGLVGADDEGLDISNIDIAAGNGQG